MKRVLKALSLLSLVFLMVITMTSCSGYDFYNDWHGAGADIEQENIFQSISLEEAEKKKFAGEKFVLLYANSSSSSAVNVVTSLQAQAEYLSATDKTIYVLDSTEFDTLDERKTIRGRVDEALETQYEEQGRAFLKMHDVPTDGSPIIMTFRNKAIDVDTSYLDKVATKKFVVDGSINYSSLASYIFKEFLVA